MVSTTSAADALIFSNATVDSCAVKFEDYIFPIQTGNEHSYNVKQIKLNKFTTLGWQISVNSIHR